MKKEQDGGREPSKNEKPINNGIDAAVYKGSSVREIALLKWMCGRG